MWATACDLVTHATFCLDRLRVLAWQRVEFRPELHSCPYNTIALSCECVISVSSVSPPLCNSLVDTSERIFSDYECKEL